VATTTVTVTVKQGSSRPCSTALSVGPYVGITAVTLGGQGSQLEPPGRSGWMIRRVQARTAAVLAALRHHCSACAVLCELVPPAAAGPLRPLLDWSQQRVEQCWKACIALIMCCPADCCPAVLLTAVLTAVLCCAVLCCGVSCRVSAPP